MTDILSQKSSQLNSEMLIVKRKNESFSYIIGTLSQFIWAINSIQLKTYQPNFPNVFSNNSLVFWRSVPIWLLGRFFCWYKNIRITPLKEIKHIYWFIFRSFGNYVGVWLWIKMLSYFRVSTCQVIAGCYPIVVIIISFFYLGEAFYFRYIICLGVCIFGSTLIVLNERNPEVAQTKLNNNIFEGLMYATCHLIISGLSNVGQKVMVKENLKADVQNYYLGLYNALPALVFCVLEWHFGLSNPLYVAYAWSNGFFVFYIGNFLQTLALEYIAVSKFMPVTYMCTVFIFILDVTILGEKLFFTDVVGAASIIGFQIYNFYNPPSSVRVKHAEVPKRVMSMVMYHLPEEDELHLKHQNFLENNDEKNDNIIEKN